MGAKPKEIQPVKLFMGVLLSKTRGLEEILPLLNTRFGDTDFVSPAMDFNRYSDYYNREMGEGVVRYFLGFKALVDRVTLPDIKNATIALEAEWTGPSGRTVNLDPGYLGLGQLFLASTKDNFCRIYLRDGIFAEVTLVYKERAWHPFPWTYRDYASEEYRALFQTLRDIYRKQLVSA